MYSFSNKSFVCLRLKFELVAFIVKSFLISKALLLRLWDVMEKSSPSVMLIESMFMLAALEVRLACMSNITELLLLPVAVMLALKVIGNCFFGSVAAFGFNLNKAFALAPMLKFVLPSMPLKCTPAKLLVCEFKLLEFEPLLTNFIKVNFAPSFKVREETFQ